MRKISPYFIVLLSTFYLLSYGLVACSYSQEEFEREYRPAARAHSSRQVRDDSQDEEILQKLEEISKAIEELKREMEAIKKELAIIKVRATQ